jgi:hypothetical protein
MFYQRSVERLAATIPDAKLVVILRHPAERCWSQYWHERTHETIHESFETVFERELSEPQEPYIVERGRYIGQLTRLTEFFPRERMHTILVDDLEADPQRIWRELCRFLEIDEQWTPPHLGETVNPRSEVRARRVFSVLNRLHVWRALPKRVAVPLWQSFVRVADREELIAPLRERVLAVYRDDNAALAQWLGRDLSAWDV